MAKAANKAEREHMNRVAELGCIVCANMGVPGSPAEVHHINNATMGKRASNYEVIPLCPFIIGWVDMEMPFMLAVKNGKRTLAPSVNFLRT